MHTITTSSCVAALATLLLLGTDAAAQERAQRPKAPASGQASTAVDVKTADYTAHELGGDQIVTFTGDELVAPERGSQGVLVTRVPGVARVGLIRPRMNFVTELLKSVENL